MPRPKAIEEVPLDMVLPPEEWALSGNETKRRVIGKHCAMVSKAIKHDKSEEIVYVILRPGCTADEFSQVVKRFLKYRPAKHRKMKKAK
jgi:hypothetical protein